MRCLLILNFLLSGLSAVSLGPATVRTIHAKLQRQPVLSLADETKPAWYEDEEDRGGRENVDDSSPKDFSSEDSSPDDPPETPLTLKDLVNTKWKVSTTNRPDGWLVGKGQEQEFTLLDDGSVVWGGEAGGFGTGGRWQITDTTIEVIRTTPLGLITGRDYYMTYAQATVNEKLQFVITGIIRSYNVLFPVAVVADFVAVRQPGRFIRDTGDDDESEKGT